MATTREIATKAIEEMVKWVLYDTNMVDPEYVQVRIVRIGSNRIVVQTEFARCWVHRDIVEESDDLDEVFYEMCREPNAKVLASADGIQAMLYEKRDEFDGGITRTWAIELVISNNDNIDITDVERVLRRLLDMAEALYKATRW